MIAPNPVPNIQHEHIGEITKWSIQPSWLIKIG